MGDPLSVVANILGILSSTFALSNAIKDLLEGTAGAPKEIQQLCRQVHTFSTIIQSLAVALQKEEVQSTVKLRGNGDILRSLKNVEAPLQDCHATLMDFMGKLKRLPNMNMSRATILFTSSMYWAVFAKSEIAYIRQRLEEAKSTLNAALNAITMLVTMRLLTTTFSAHVEHQPASEQFSHQQRIPFPINDGKYGPAYITLMVAERMLGSVTNLVHESYHAILSNDYMLRQRYAHLFCSLGEQRSQIEKLGSAIRVAEKSHLNFRKVIEEGRETSGDIADQMPQCDGLGYLMSDAFMNLVSRFSVNKAQRVFDQVHTSLSGSPDYSWERSPNFFPETLAVKGEIMMISRVIPMGDSREIYLTYQSGPRRWRQVVVVATSRMPHNRFADLIPTTPSDTVKKLSGMTYTLPKSFDLQLRSILKGVEYYGTATKLSVQFETAGSSIVADETSMKVTEATSEWKKKQERQALRVIEDLGCRKFAESSIINLDHPMGGHRFRVLIEGHKSPCVERKAHFTKSGGKQDYDIIRVIDAIKRLSSLQLCHGIVQLLGVVVSDDGKHVKGYLEELSAVCNLNSFIGFANGMEKPVPWSVRESWIKHLIAIIAEVHRRGQIVGALSTYHTCLRFDQSVVLNLRETAEGSLLTEPGCLPPELQESAQSDDYMLPGSVALDFKTDIYQLGYVIWLIALNRTAFYGRRFLDSRCTATSGSDCNAKNCTNIILPPCGQSEYIDDIVGQCRQSDPADRPSAHQLLQLLPSSTVIGKNSLVTGLIDDYVGLKQNTRKICEECTNLAIENFYHCHICKGNDFDLCVRCFDKGFYCLDKGHVMVKMGTKRGHHYTISDAPWRAITD